ncbi:MAG TPA: LD-carboxypeptidase [Dongiaceae bacterium]
MAQHLTLKPGDCATIIAPASPLRQDDQGLLDEAVRLLESWGLRVKLRVETEAHFYLAGTDAARAAHLNAALADPEAKAIFCTCGGYGSPRLLPLIEVAPGLVPKILVGFSDITALHLGLARLAPQLTLIHGPNIATGQILGSEASCRRNQQALHAALFDAAYRLDEQVEMLVPGQATGPLTGGCLSLVVSLLGTDWAPRCDGAILFLEDVGEAPYRIDRMLIQLRNAGAFRDLRGLVFGKMTNCSDPHNDLRDVLLHLFRDAPFPVALDLDCGHGAVNLPLPLGVVAEIDGAARRFRLPASGRK